MRPKYEPSSEPLLRLMVLSNTVDAWYVTGGTDAGIMKHMVPPLGEKEITRERKRERECARAVSALSRVCGGERKRACVRERQRARESERERGREGERESVRACAREGQSDRQTPAIQKPCTPSRSQAPPPKDRWSCFVVMLGLQSTKNPRQGPT